MDVRHDGAEALVNFLGSPLEAHGVLRHLQTGSGDTTCVGGFARAVEDLGTLEDFNCFGSRRHVCTFGYAEATVLDEVLGIGFLDLVLRSARHSDVARDAPRTLAGEVLCLRELLRVLLDTSTTDVLEFKDVVHLLLGQSFGIIDETIGVAQSEHLGTQTHRFLCGILRYITCAGDADTLALERLATGSQHRLSEIASTVTGCLGAHERTTPQLAFAGQRAGELVAKTFVLTKEETDLTSAYAYITGRYVGICANVALQLGHKRLTETHHLGITFATRREITSALGAAHRQRGQRVLEGLLEGEELHNRQVHRLVETYTAFVRANGAIHLHTESAVDLHFALIVHPRHTEHYHALGFNDALHDLLLAQIRVRHDHRRYTFHYFADGLVKLLLARVFLNQVGHKLVNINLGLLVHSYDIYVI